MLSWVETRWRIGWPPLRDGFWTWTGVLVFSGASAFGLWSCLSMAVRGEGTPLPASTARNLVAVGPYRCVARFGVDYERYRTRVRCWIPSLR